MATGESAVKLVLSAAALMVATGCAPSVSERARTAGLTPVAKYPVVAAAGHTFAAYLYALNEPSFDGVESAGLKVRLLVLSSEPGHWSLLRVEAAPNGAVVHCNVAGQRPFSYTVSAASWAALQDTLTAVDVWTAPWKDFLTLDGWMIGLEIREGERHRALWLLNPDQDPKNEGFMRLYYALNMVGSLADAGHTAN